MGNKLKPERLDDAQRDGALQALASPDPAEAVRAAALSPGQWLTVANHAAGEDNVAALKAIEAHVAHKGLTKALRRLFHKLRSRGVDVTAARSGAVKLGVDRSPSFIGVIAPGSPAGDFCACIQRRCPGEPDSPILIMEQSGTQTRCDVMACTRAQAGAFFRSVLNDGEGPRWVRAEGAYMAWLGALCVRRAREGELDLGAYDAELAVSFPQPDPDAPHPVDALLEARGERVARALGVSGDVFDDPMFRVAFLERLQDVGLSERVEPVVESRLVLDNGQIFMRVREAVNATIDAMIASLTPARVAAGLRHNAWYAASQERWDAAAAFASVAGALDAGDMPAHEIPFYSAATRELTASLVSFAQAQRDGLNAPDAPGDAPTGGEAMSAVPPIGSNARRLWLPGQDG